LRKPETVAYSFKKLAHDALMQKNWYQLETFVIRRAVYLRWHCGKTLTTTFSFEHRDETLQMLEHMTWVKGLVVRLLPLLGTTNKPHTVRLMSYCSTRKARAEITGKSLCLNSP